MPTNNSDCVLSTRGTCNASGPVGALGCSRRILYAATHFRVESRNQPDLILRGGQKAAEVTPQVYVSYRQDPKRFMTLAVFCTDNLTELGVIFKASTCNFWRTPDIIVGQQKRIVLSRGGPKMQGALVTGASRGVGRGAAISLNEAGFEVFATRALDE